MQREGRVIRTNQGYQLVSPHEPVSLSRSI
jgi:hypothetical protein